MTVTEKLQGVGSWSVRLRPDTPAQILDALLLAKSGRGHVVITPTWLDLGALSDADALALSRYTGIYLKRVEETLTLSGYGVNGWLGDGDRGRSVGNFGTSGFGAGSGTFAEWAAALTPSFLTAGIVSSIAGTYVKVFTRTYFREIINDVAARFGAFWRVNNQFELDFGTAAALFKTTPTALIVRHRADAGRDFNVHGITGDLQMTRDVEDWAWRVLYWWGGTPTLQVQTGGIADADVPFRGPDGSPAWVDMIIEDSQTTTSGDADALALTQWNRFTGVRNEFTLSSSEYDIARDIQVGDNVLVFDLQRGIYNTANPVTYRGQTIHPATIQCVGYTWPVREGMGVWFRRYVKPSTTWVPEWIDLSPYVMWEDGDTTVEVGAKPRATL